MSQQYVFIIPGVDERTGDNAIQIVCDKKDKTFIKKVLLGHTAITPFNISEGFCKPGQIQLNNSYQFIITFGEEVSSKEEYLLIMAIYKQLSSIMGNKAVACL